METSNVTQSIKPTIRGVPFGIFAGGVVAALVLPILYPWLCNHALPPADATKTKDFFFSMADQTLSQIILGAGAGAVGGSLLVKGAKVFAQLKDGMATDATPIASPVTSPEPPQSGPSRAALSKTVSRDVTQPKIEVETSE